MDGKEGDRGDSEGPSVFSSSEGSQADTGTLRCWILPWEIFRPHLSLGWKAYSAGKGRQKAKDSDSRHRAQQGGAGRAAQGSAERCCLGAWETGGCAQGCSRLGNGCVSKVRHQGSEVNHETCLPYCIQERGLTLRGQEVPQDAGADSQHP